MKAILRSDIGRGLTGIGLSIGIIAAVMFPVLLMDLFTKLMSIG